jgi:hypothetical protein
MDYSPVDIPAFMLTLVKDGYRPVLLFERNIYGRPITDCHEFYLAYEIKEKTALGRTIPVFSHPRKLYFYSTMRESVIMGKNNEHWIFYSHHRYYLDNRFACPFNRYNIGSEIKKLDTIIADLLDNGGSAENEQKQRDNLLTYAKEKNFI